MLHVESKRASSMAAISVKDGNPQTVMVTQIETQSHKMGANVTEFISVIQINDSYIILIFYSKMCA